MVLFASVCQVPGSLKGKTILVTGCNDGVGLEITGELVRRGARVIMGCRDVVKAEYAKTTLIQRYGEASDNGWMNTRAKEEVKPYLVPVTADQLIIEKMELGSFNHVRDFAKRVSGRCPKLDILIHNVLTITSDYWVSPDGFEGNISVNHLAAVLLTELLMPSLKAAAPSRVVFVTSTTHSSGTINLDKFGVDRDNYKVKEANAQSTLANIMYARILGNKLAGSGVTVVCVNQAFTTDQVSSELGRKQAMCYRAVLSPFLCTPWEAAQTCLFVALSKCLIPGGFYKSCRIQNPNSKALDADVGQRVYDLSRKLVGVDS